MCKGTVLCRPLGSLLEDEVDEFPTERSSLETLADACRIQFAAGMAVVLTCRDDDVVVTLFVVGTVCVSAGASDGGSGEA